MSEALLLLLRLNLAVSTAIVVAMLVRRPLRRAFGARVAYGLWMLIPLAAAAMLAPARVIVVSQPSLAQDDEVAASVPDIVFAPVLQLPVGPDIPALLCILWLGGALIALGALVWAQAQFARAVRAGRGGPAVVGVLRPRIVTPDDFARRYTPREQRVILAHEATHIARQDSRINALVAIARCACWFNPLIHLMARCLRIDQELACDAQVVAAHPRARRTYAEAMLKTQLAARPLPLGCYWLASSAHPLTERVGLLIREAPSPATRGLGLAIVSAMVLVGAWTAWTARPTELRFEAASAPARPAKPTVQQDKASPAPPVGAMLGAPTRTPTRRPATSLAPLSVLTLPEPAAVLTPAALPPTEGGAAAAGSSRLLPTGFFGPAKVHSAAPWSQVQPGSAVRVLATMTDPQGIPLITDLTAFGSQSRFRIGYIERNASRYKLFTRVVQHGDRLLVTAALNRSFHPMVSGSTELASGETGTIQLPNGLVATVTPTIRAETPEEIADAARTGDHRFVSVERVEAR
ncbi:MAG TPA: M56 family metallopeptidase [Phenylobacterium sp.]|jgi:beta-lactamase regulating signal transducer with metallopeptidase domain